MAVAKVYQDGQWIPLADGSPDLVNTDTLDLELSYKSDINHDHNAQYQYLAARHRLESTWTSGALSNSRSAAIMTITVNGDGIRGLALDAHVQLITTAATTARLEIWDGTVGSGTLVAIDWNQMAATSARAGLHCFGEMAPFVGSKTFNACVFSSAAATLSAGDANSIAASYPHLLRAKYTL